jgi:ClpP class serine protease
MFIGLVRARRGTRLSASEKTVFSGEYWVAKTAKDFGLVDQLGDLRSFLRQRYGEAVATPLIASERTLFGRRPPGVTGPDRVLEEALDRRGMIDDIISAIESRAMWARFGL